MPTNDKAAPSIIPDQAKKSPTSMELMTQAPRYLERANALQVTTVAEHRDAIALLTEIATRNKELTAEREKINGPLHAAWKASCDFFNRLAEPYTTVDKVVRQKVLTYERAERQKAEDQRLANEREAQRKRDKIAADAREATRLSNLKVENERKEAARLKAQQEEAQRKADLLTKSGNHVAAAQLQSEATQAGAAAIKAERRAENIETRAEARVETLTQQASTIVAAIVEAPVLKAEGRKTRKVWKWKLKDVKKLDPKYTVPNDTMLNTLVRSMKKEAEVLVGEGAIEVWEEDDLSITAAK